MRPLLRRSVDPLAVRRSCTDIPARSRTARQQVSGSRRTFALPATSDFTDERSPRGERSEGDNKSDQRERLPPEAFRIGRLARWLLPSSQPS
jgi:hypothetical protein